MKILLVCGQARLVSAIKKFLKSKEDYGFHYSLDCQKAWEVISEEKVDLLIIDLKMFNGEGVEFLKRASEIQPETKIIGISSSGFHRKYYLENGCNGFLRSKFNFDDFKQELERIFPGRFNFEEEV
ncbi:MAG: response regulator [Candidatus Moraniibacteriota bacterium]